MEMQTIPQHVRCVHAMEVQVKIFHLSNARVNIRAFLKLFLCVPLFDVKLRGVPINSMFESDVNIVRAAINSCEVHHEVHGIVRVAASK
mmetsp:Transcript_25992/g.49383  ORF Transcript_25992/g.49383 Transcript_25992/m.49383 type:complete len:89 (+) Transcript_25992:72-338(+)